MRDFLRGGTAGAGAAGSGSWPRTRVPAAARPSDARTLAQLSRTSCTRQADAGPEFTGSRSTSNGVSTPVATFGITRRRALPWAEPGDATSTVTR
ncbi:twin-arginine translocation signal domain-containing protein [Mumia zhuanghuii]|uniref:Twin-arginine translocation signal domain-containing protein n=1 Tax=Mumia zhuanghuii TaxID=2585211 RepID=A0A5C4MZH5_9ACTN|nr:twin-arginine translocation signal domain-containing protein [Mumia zhuanghuii]TNC50229.1 twin-arginine translocation signal domain-containing protein [Mumia zhuanghuii]